MPRARNLGVAAKGFNFIARSTISKKFQLAGSLLHYLIPPSLQHGHKTLNLCPYVLSQMNHSLFVCKHSLNVLLRYRVLRA